jgi:hypothetical protein
MPGLANVRCRDGLELGRPVPVLGDDETIDPASERIARARRHCAGGFSQRDDRVRRRRRVPQQVIPHRAPAVDGRQRVSKILDQVVTNIHRFALTRAGIAVLVDQFNSPRADIGFRDAQPWPPLNK